MTRGRASRKRGDRRRRRGARPGRAARPLRHAEDQPQRRVPGRRRLHQPSRQHHHISGKYLGAYAREMAWREDTRRRPNGSLHVLAAGAALGHPVSRMWKGYWQRAAQA